MRAHKRERQAGLPDEASIVQGRTHNEKTAAAPLASMRGLAPAVA
jgi:hypothetical protein